MGFFVVHTNNSLNEILHCSANWGCSIPAFELGMLEEKLEFPTFSNNHVDENLQNGKEKRKISTVRSAGRIEKWRTKLFSSSKNEAYFPITLCPYSSPIWNSTEQYRLNASIGGLSPYEFWALCEICCAKGLNSFQFSIVSLGLRLGLALCKITFAILGNSPSAPIGWTH